MRLSTSPIQLVVLSLTFFAGAYAQAERADNTVIEEVLVTAQKRTESVMDVPISINVVDGVLMEEYGFKEMRYLDDLVPNLSIGKSAASDGISMRGVGSSAGNLTVEQSVAMFVDGVYGGRSHQWQNPLFDAARVEVLRGPQGALVGKNTLAGAVNVLTRKPTDQFEAEIRVGREFEMDGYDITAIISGPLTDRFSARFAAKYEEEDGWIKNPYSGDDEPGTRTFIARATGVYDADDVTITGKLEYSRVDEAGCFYDTFGPTESPRPSYVNGCTGYPPTGELDFDDTESPNATVQVDWALGEHTLTSITAYSSYDTEKLTDANFSEFSLVGARFFEDFEQVSQEVRWLSPGGRKFEYIVGAYYHQWDLTTNRVSLFNNFGPFNGTISRVGDQEDWLASGFAQGTWHINEQLEVSGSLRYTHEEKDGFITRFTTGIAPGLTTDFGQSRTEDHVDPSLSVQWHVNDSTMLFVSYTEGSKGGGFTADSTAVTPADFQFEDEHSESIEVGVKYQGQRTRLQFTAYRSDFEDQQVSIYDSNTLVFVSENVGQSRSQGFELEALWQATDSLSVSGSLAYLDAYYTYWPEGRCLWPRDTDTTCREDRKDTKFEVPEWEGVVSANYTRNVSENVNFLAGVIVTYQTDHHRFQDPRCELDAYSKVHARVGLESTDGTWSAALSGRNLSNKKTWSGCVATPLLAGWLTYNTEPTKQVMFELAYRWR